MMRFTVLRQHFGDRLYQAGEVREAMEVDVRHLVNAGVLAATENKAEVAAPENKAAKKASAKK